MKRVLNPDELKKTLQSGLVVWHPKLLQSLSSACGLSVDDQINKILEELKKLETPEQAENSTKITLSRTVLCNRILPENKISYIEIGGKINDARSQNFITIILNLYIHDGYGEGRNELIKDLTAHFTEVLKLQQEEATKHKYTKPHLPKTSGIKRGKRQDIINEGHDTQGIIGHKDPSRGSMSPWER